MDWILYHLSELLANNQFLQGGAVLAVVTWFGYQLKAIPTFVGNKIRYYATYTVHFDQGSEFYRVFSEWLNETHPAKFRNIEVSFQGETNNEPQAVGPSRNSEAFKRRFELKKHQYSDANVIRHKGRWLWIAKDRARLDAARDVRAMFYNSYTITGLFAKSAIEDICEQIALRRNAEVEDDALQVYFSRNDYFEQQSINVVKTLDHIFFEQKAQLLADLEEFIGQKDLYAQKGIQYKRSYLFYGPGGTGKTSLGLAIAKYLNYDLFVINLASIKSDQDLQSMSPRIGKRSVVLLEDIDCVLRHREVKSKKVNFSTILNFLDGLYAPSDCIFVLTTNKPDELDEALTRKGRVDLALHIDYPHVSEVEAYMSDFYDYQVRLPLAPGTKAIHGMAMVQDICLQNTLDQARQMVLTAFIYSNGHKKPAHSTTKAMSDKEVV